MNVQDTVKSMMDYTKAIELKPDYASAYLNRGNIYLDLNKYQEAINDYENAIANNSAYESDLRPIIDKAKERLNLQNTQNTDSNKKP